MSYNNLLYLLVVIFLLSAQPVPDQASLPFWQAILFFSAKFAFFYFVCRRLFSPGRVGTVQRYIRAEKYLSLLAIAAMAADIYLLDCLYFFSFLPFAGSLPVIGRFAGLLLFFAYLSTVWLVASTRSGALFGRTASSRMVVYENIRANLPIVLPWVFISLVIDILYLLPVPAISSFMDSGSGEVVILAVFFFFIALIFPPLLMRIWGCRPLAAGAVRDHMAAFCRDLRLSYRDIMIWPLFGGQLVTAGVVGFIGAFRYILLTPGLLASLNSEEIDAVLAHEIGHVKRYHMQLYLLVLLGFSILVNPLVELVLYATLHGDWFYALAERSAMPVASLLDLFLPASLLVLLVLFLRFVFGFFMRNFERQADLYALQARGDGVAISAALEKVALLSGDIRDMPSWHHYGIAERVDFLAACDKKPELVRGHHRKVYLALGFYSLLVVLAAGLHFALPEDLIERAVTERTIGKLEEQAALEPGNYQIYWALGDMQFQRRAYAKAIDAYEHSLQLVPDNPEVLNNLAWLLVTSQDEAYLDPEYAQELATRAATLKPAPHILDTLAHAYWLLGKRELALEIEKRALSAARPENKRIYAEQVRKWQAELTNRGGHGIEF